MKENFLKKNNSNEGYYSKLQSLGKNKDGMPFLNRNNQDLSKYQSFQGSSFYEIGKSEVKLSDIVFSEQLQKEVNELIDEYLYQKSFQKYGFKYDNKIIFHGSSGCGKTMTALALANVLKKKIYLVNLSTIVSSSLGKTSNNIFEIVEDAKANQAIVFFDEFDALSKIRSDENDHGEMKRVTSALLQIMDFLDEKTIFIAATNHIDLIDKAIIRRFNRKISFELPGKKNLVIYLRKLILSSKLKIDEKVVTLLAEQFKNLSYAEARDEFLRKIKKYIIKNNKENKRDLRVIKNDILKIN